MYCPKCGLRQLSEDAIFCSQCGLSLAELAGWLAGSNALMPAQPEAGWDLSPRRKGMRRGAKLLFFSVVMLPLFFGIAIALDAPVLMLLPLTLFMAGIAKMLYTRLFVDETEAPFGHQPKTIHAQRGAGALPPGGVGAASPFNRPRVNTAEMRQPPPSVTDHTTNLLKKE